MRRGLDGDLELTLAMMVVLGGREGDGGVQNLELRLQNEVDVPIWTGDRVDYAI